MRISVATSCLLLGAAVVASGCMGSGGSCAASQGFSGQGAVCNEKDSFHYGLQGAQTTKSESFKWENSKSKAHVAMVFQGTGQAGVTVKDAAGTTVFAKTFTGPGQAAQSHVSNSGKAGAWTIGVQMTNVNGQMGLTVTASS